jgi:hypothetical protein
LGDYLIVSAYDSEMDLEFTLEISVVTTILSQVGVNELSEGFDLRFGRQLCHKRFEIIDLLPIKFSVAHRLHIHEVFMLLLEHFCYLIQLFLELI